MPRAKRQAQTWTASQVVAHNVTRARELRGMTQTEVAERLTRFTDATWSQVTVAQAEGSVSGNRIRQFSANELVALARTFDLPVLWFFLPPDVDDHRFEIPDMAGGLPWEYLLTLAWGHAKNFGPIADRTSRWAHIAPSVTVPHADILDDPERQGLAVSSARSRTGLRPDDFLAAAFYGLARKRMAGSMIPGQEVEDLAYKLRGLADALLAFNNYAPAEFLPPALIEQLVEEGRDRAEEE